MKRIKIMPCLDMKNGRVVKGVKFADLRDAGDPIENARFYDEEGADELAMLDISATLEGRQTRLQWVKDVLGVIHIPLTVGGGIKTLTDISQLSSLGVSKISINTAAVQQPTLIHDASQCFGRERIVVAIDAWRNEEMPSGFEVVIRGGTTGTGRDVVKWSKQCEALGAGELLLTSVDADGTQNGYDIEYTRAVAHAVALPIIASGGVGTLEHLYDGVVRGGATTLLAASIFHFRTLSIREVKKYLKSRGLNVTL